MRNSYLSVSQNSGNWKNITRKNMNDWEKKKKIKFFSIMSTALYGFIKMFLDIEW